MSRDFSRAFVLEPGLHGLSSAADGGKPNAQKEFPLNVPRRSEVTNCNPAVSLNRRDYHNAKED